MDKELKKPQITAYESILLIFSELVKRGKTLLRQDQLVPILYSFKDKEQTRVLFEDIVFKNRIDSITSDDVENSLSTLQAFGAIGKLNPAYEKIVIYISLEEAGRMLNEAGESYVAAAKIISEAF